MRYEVPVRFSGRIMYSVAADSEEAAMDKANTLAEEADCGDLEDIDWETNRPVSCIEDAGEPAQPDETIKFIVPALGTTYFTCRSLQLAHAAVPGTSDYKLYITESKVVGYSYQDGLTEDVATEDGESPMFSTPRPRPLAIMLQDKSGALEAVSPKAYGSLDVLNAERMVAGAPVAYSKSRKAALDYAHTLAENIRRNYARVGNIVMPEP